MFDIRYDGKATKIHHIMSQSMLNMCVFLDLLMVRLRYLFFRIGFNIFYLDPPIRNGGDNAAFRSLLEQNAKIQKDLFVMAYIEIVSRRGLFLDIC